MNSPAHAAPPTVVPRSQRIWATLRVSESHIKILTLIPECIRACHRVFCNHMIMGSLYQVSFINHAFRHYISEIFSSRSTTAINLKIKAQMNSIDLYCQAMLCSVSRLTTTWKRIRVWKPGGKESVQNANKRRNHSLCGFDQQLLVN